MRASIAGGLDHSLKQENVRTYFWLAITDCLFSCLLIAPLVVGFWCSTWSVVDHLLMPTMPMLSALLSALFGFCAIWLFTTFQRELNSIFSDRITNKPTYFIGTRLYTEIFAIASVNSWRGVWLIMELYTGTDVVLIGFVIFICYCGLIGTKTLRNLTASPLAIITDQSQGYFDVPTLFHWSYYWKKNKFLYLLDSVFSVMIVGILVILVWRGTWCLLDNYIYPDNEEKSGWVSLIIGYGIVFITFLLQPLMKILIRKYRYWRRLVIIDIYVVISFCGTINIWRGMWMVYDKYCQLDGLLSSVLVHFTTFLILVLFNSSNTLLVRGVYIDAEENAENCIEFPCYYFRLIFQEKQKKKAIANLNLQHQKDTLLRNNAGTEDIKEKEMDILDSNGKVKALTDNSTSAAKSIVNSTLEKRETNESRIAVTDGAAVSSNSYEYDTDQYSTENGTAVKSINRV